MAVTLAEAALKALKVYRTFEGGRPDLVPLCIPPVDEDIGGILPGQSGILGADTGVGKSSIILASALARGPDDGKVGILSLEDPEEVLGTRALAAVANVDSRAIRKGDLTQEDLANLKKAMAYLEKAPISIEYAKPDLDNVLHGLDRLVSQGCKLIWVDYVQKVRGLSANRAAEVAKVFTEVQTWGAANKVAVMWISQLRRRKDKDGKSMRYTRPAIEDLKESGDLENESRLVILCWQDGLYQDIIHCWLAKNSYGKAGAEWKYVRNLSGALEFKR